MNQPDIAIVIPCYNHANILERTLRAVLAQTLKPAEIIVVDDGSSDHPEAVVKWVASPLVTFVRYDQNKGAPAARNEGARRTTSPFLIFLDADAELTPDALETMRHALDQHPEVDFVYSDFLWGSKLFRGKPFSVDELKKRNYIHTSSLLRRKAFPGFDESLTKLQDWDLWLTMCERGSKGIWIDKTLYRIEPRHEGMSRWLPKVMYLIPWKRVGIKPKEVERYEVAEAIVKKKHGIV
ncbi:MAG: glycosyltransferase family A protein [Patescibacteria group bacterium]